MNFNSDTGKLTSSVQKTSMVHFLNIVKEAMDKSVENIPFNKLSQGRTFDSDFDYHFEVITSNTVKEISRSYFT